MRFESADSALPLGPLMRWLVLVVLSVSSVSATCT